MIRLFGLYLMTENELMELDEKWFPMISDIQKNRQSGLIVHEAPGKWEYRTFVDPMLSKRVSTDFDDCDYFWGPS